MSEFEATIMQGDTVTLSLAFTSSIGGAYVVSGAQAITFEVVGPDGTPLISKGIGDGVVVTGASAGTVELGADETADLPAPATYRCVLRVTDAVGKVFTVAQGNLTLDAAPEFVAP